MNISLVKPIDLEWLGRYHRQLVEAAMRFPEHSEMRVLGLLRADFALDLYKAWAESPEAT